MIKTFRNINPKIGNNVFIAQDALVLGDCELGDDSSVFFKSVLRGDVNRIIIGKGVNVQDLCMLHVTEEHELFIGDGVSIGHHVVLHGCRVENNCLIGMGAIVLDGAIIGAGSVVAAGSVVPPGKEYGENQLIMGNPAKVVRELKVNERELYQNHYKSYIKYKDEFIAEGSF